MTNPYVFINVSVNAVKKNGHRMHRDFPNKTWKEAAVWNGGSYEAGDARPDYIALLDGDFVNRAWCEAAPTSPGEPTDGEGTPPVVGGIDEPEGEVAGIEKTRKPPVKKPAVKGTEAVPTAVAAGIGGSGPTSGSSPIGLLAQMLVGGGLALLLSAGWMQIGRKASWVNQA